MKKKKKKEKEKGLKTKYIIKLSPTRAVAKIIFIIEIYKINVKIDKGNA